MIIKQNNRKQFWRDVDETSTRRRRDDTASWFTMNCSLNTFSQVEPGASHHPSAGHTQGGIQAWHLRTRPQFQRPGHCVQTYRLTDWQTYGRTDAHTHGRTDKQTRRLVELLSCWIVEIQPLATYRLADLWRYKLIDSRTYRLTHSAVDRRISRISVCIHTLRFTRKYTNQYWNACACR